MKFKELFLEDNEAVEERFNLSMDRIKNIINEESVKEPYANYFKSVSKFIMQIWELINKLDKNQFEEMSLEELKDYNNSLYFDLFENQYKKSYANPEYAVIELGEDYGQLLSFLYTEIRGMIIYAYENRLVDITIICELFIEIYNYFEEEQLPSYKQLKSAVYYYISDYSDYTLEYRVREQVDQSLSFATEIIMESDLNNLKYLFGFGEFISDNELKIAKYLNQLSEDKIDLMASTYTNGLKRAIENLGSKKTEHKKTVNVRYSIGFERMVRKAINNLKDMGLEPTIFRAAVNSINKKQHLKIGYHSTSPNKQYDYDHRFDSGLYLDKALNERRLANLRVAYEKYKDKANEFIGPAVIEIFGETPFEPVNKPEAIKLDEKQQKLLVAYNNDSSILTNEYIKREQYTFTIIAFPIPEIGENFEEIFEETIKVNTLDSDKYRKIQENIINVLDKGDYVKIIGKDGNKTDLSVNLYELEDSKTQTIFENCLADVNIPVGEVFTSPVLSKTDGILNISQVYLNGLKYIDLTLTFKDGKITEYSCKNFESEDQNKKYIKENLLYNHETLPIGEFAIGTNTTAYVMANKYNITYKLPILIAEKMGPHFAIGDTCYNMSEDNKVYNPDGKEVVAKDNEISILRKTNKELAYFNCHTDITIPYDELKEISVYTKGNEKIEIIMDGRFVLEGTLELNEAFE